LFRGARGKNKGKGKGKGKVKDKIKGRVRGRVLATQSIVVYAQYKGYASLYNWIVYKRESKAKERKGEEEQRRSK